MKLNKYFMLAIAGVAFAACNNEDEVVTNGNQDGRVYVNLSLGSAETRSLSESAAGLKNDIDNVTIYFYTANGTYVQDVQPGEGNDNEIALKNALETLKTEKEASVTLTNIPSSANQIYIVANEPASHPIDKTSLAKVKKSIIYLSEQVATTFTKFSGEKSTLTGLSIIQDGSDNQSTASVKLKPVPSRIEVKNFIATPKPSDFGGSEIQSFTVEGIYINAFYTQGYLDDEITIEDNNKVDNGSDTQKYTEAAYGDNAFMCDDLEEGEYTSTASTTEGEIWKVSPVLAEATHPYWGYQVLKGDVPHMVVKMNVTYEGATVAEERYLTITGYKKKTGGELEKVERGAVYRITDLKFDASDLTPTPYEKSKTVTATVEVLAWTPVEIEPNL